MRASRASSSANALSSIWRCRGFWADSSCCKMRRRDRLIESAACFLAAWKLRPADLPLTCFPTLGPCQDYNFCSIIGAIQLARYLDTFIARSQEHDVKESIFPIVNLVFRKSPLQATNEPVRGSITGLRSDCCESTASEVRSRSSVTHEEIAQMIGSSRETVPRLLSELKKKELIRLEGSTLVIRNRTALEALAA
jgi:hypothetical protein